MPVAPVQYHWLFGPSSTTAPQTFHQYTTSLILPENATLRRILINETNMAWKRGSADFANQEAYFVNYNVVYGAASGAPVLYRTSRRIPSVLVADAAGFTEGVFSIHSASDLELGMNEKVQRGGWGTPPQEIFMNWSIFSSGDGSEFLAGMASMPFRVLYSLPVPP